MAADVDHKATTVVSHGGNNGSADLHDAREVELQEPLPPLKGHGQKITGIGSTGVVDQHRGGLALPKKVFNTGCNGRWIRQIQALQATVAPLDLQF